MSDRQHRYNISEKGRAARRRYQATAKARAKERWRRARYRRRDHGRFVVIPAYVRADGTVVRSFKRRIGRSRRVYWAARYGANAERINVMRRAQYVPHTQRRSLRLWRDERQRHIAAEIEAENARMLKTVTMIPELAKLVAEQESDARTFRIKRPALFVSPEEAERLFYGGVYPEEA